MKVLVAYGSRYGSTQETAAAIARRLTAHDDVEVDLLDAADVDGIDGYDLAVVGSGIYAGFLRRRVVRLLHRIARQRPGLPVAAFAQGPLAPERDKPEEWTACRRRLTSQLDHVEGLHLVASEVFGGAFDPERVRFMFGHGEAIDVRDWTAIDRWTDALLDR